MNMEQVDSNNMAVIIFGRAPGLQRLIQAYPLKNEKAPK